MQTVAGNLGSRALPLVVDVSDAAAVSGLVDATIAAFERIDILCNNAGFGLRGTVVTIDEADWDRIMAVNVRSVFLCSKHAMPHLIASGNGRIVNTSSYTSFVGIPDRAAYVASKGAITALTRAMALDHVGDGVRVNAVAPGTVDSRYFQEMLAIVGDPSVFATRAARHVPHGTPQEIAEAIAWLASGRSSFATGSVLTVDGGSTSW